MWLFPLRVSATTLCDQADPGPWGIQETQGPEAETLSEIKTFTPLIMLKILAPAPAGLPAATRCCANNGGVTGGSRYSSQRLCDPLFTLTPDPPLSAR